MNLNCSHIVLIQNSRNTYSGNISEVYYYLYLAEHY